MSVNDIESLLKDIRDFMKDNLNTEIAAINTAKGDFTTETIPADSKHYFVGAEMVDLPNCSYVAIGIDDVIIAENVHNDVSHQLPIVIEVVFASQNKPTDAYKSLRYMKAVENTMLGYEEATDQVGGLQFINNMPMILQADKRKLITSGITVNIGLA